MPTCDINPASEEYADFIIRHNNRTLEQIKEDINLNCVFYLDSSFALAYVPLADVEPITFAKDGYTSIPKLYTLLDTTSMEASGITATANQPALQLRGEGSLIGFIDTGIDYQNPLFRNPDGSSRIVGIWDQTLPPEPFVEQDSLRIFPYGRQFTQIEITEALQSPAPLSIVPSTDENGHGTFLAGIAAGNTSPELDFTGAAPMCNLGVVKLKPAKQYLRDFYCIDENAIAYQENDIMMAIRYLMSLAAKYLKPLTILIGLGTNYGSHDGTSPLALILRGLERLVGVCTVIAAGNEAGLAHHYLGRVNASDEYDDVEVRVAPEERGFLLELWATQPELYTVGFISPTGEVVSRIPISQSGETVLNFFLDQTKVTVNYRTSEISSGSQFILMRFQTPSPGIWHIRVYNSLFITGIYHMWLPVEGFIKEGTIFLRPDPDTTITEPANASTPITISTYNHNNNSIYIHSSRGFARGGYIKPDIAAPGVNIYGPGLPPVPGGTNFPMVRKTGSSIAAAHAAGAVASLFTWGLVRGNDALMSDTNIRAYLIRGAERNPAYTYPNREWGFGTLDLYETFLRMRE